MKAVKVMLPVRTVKRLFAAEGYLELGMPEHALEELALIEDAAPIEASVEYLTGEAFRQQERYDDAVESLVNGRNVGLVWVLQAVGELAILKTAVVLGLAVLLFYRREVAEISV